jgi:D-sedoheptulose 7-phosphate isomerase
MGPAPGGYVAEPGRVMIGTMIAHRSIRVKRDRRVPIAGSRYNAADYRFRERRATKQMIREYLDGMKSLLDELDTDKIEKLIGLLETCWLEGRRVMLIGNGGSASSASHIVNDLQKCVQLDAGRALKAMCLADCSPLVLAWANDEGYDNDFAPQVECWGEPGDLLIAISGSGNSPNVLKAVEVARRKGVTVFGLSGFAGGLLAPAADECIVVGSDSMQRIEDVHLIVLHMAFVGVRERAMAHAANGAA